MSKVDVKFGATDDGLAATLGKLNGALDNIDKNTKKASESVNGSFASMVKAGAALAIGFGAIKAAAALVSGTLGTFKDALDLGGTLADMSARTGIAIKDLVVLGRAFENAGKSADDVGPVINKMQKAIVEAGEGSAGPKAAFDLLGISLDDIKKKSPADQLELIGKAISGIQDPAQKTKIAMDIFGKSGADMMAFFDSGKDGIAGARKELGSFADIMGVNSAQMDTISDQFNAIKNKALEFAAGMLSKLLPAIELVTTGLSRIDAAALGVKLGEVITGGSNAMKGFSDALAAVKLGEFGTAFDIAFNSIKLQAADSINSIYANIQGLFAAIPVFLDQSGILMILDNLVMGIANKLSSSLRSVIAEFLQSIGRLGAAADMRLFSDADADRAKLYFNLVNVGISSIGHNIGQAGDAAKAAYDKAQAGAGKLIETSKLENSLQSTKIGLLHKQAEEAMKAAKQIETNGILDVKFSGQRVTNAERIKELEGEIKDARAQGNEALAKELEATKAYYEQLERALEKGLTQQDALAAAAKAYQASIDGALKGKKKETEELEKQLGIVEKITAQILAAQKAQGIDKGGKIQNQIQQQIDGGNFKRAKRLNERLADKIDEDLIRRKDDKVDRRNLNDIAKDMGIDTFRMNRDQMRAAILKKRQDELKPGKKKEEDEGKVAAAEAKRNAAAETADRKAAAESLKNLVEKIHGLVAKIEPKLPQHALN